jgi:uncharacterized phiE125 gp8 family phage protein
MALVPISPPAVEPVALADLKHHLRIDDTAEDASLASFITTSRLQIEAALSLALVTQSWNWRFDRWPNRCGVELPISPVRSITQVSLHDRSGAAAVMPPGGYILDGQTIPARIIVADGRWTQPTAPALGVGVQFVAGFGPAAADVPAPIRQAVLLLAAHWYGRRDPGGCGGAPAAAAGSPASPIPQVVDDLLQPYRRPRL